MTLRNDTPSMESLQAKKKVTELHPEEILSAARLMATQHMPYIASALWNLIIKWMPGLETMAVTKRGVCYIDPEILPVWGVYQTMVGLLHETSHLLRDHAARTDLAISVQGQLHPMVEAVIRKIANVAGDAELNDDLEDTGLQLLPTDVIPQKLQCDRGLTMEEYMNHLIKKAEQNAQQGQAPMMGMPQPGRGDTGSGDGADGEGCGSVAGNPNPKCEGDSDADGNPKNDGKTSDGEGRSDAEIDRLKKEVAEKVKEHQAAHGKGSVPGGWDVWADQQLQPPKVPWEQKLQKVCRNGVSVVKGMMDYRYGRPSRRQAGVGFGAGRPVLPSMISYMPHALFVIDTSGSMGSTETERGMSESNGVMNSMGVKLSFGTIDAAVHEPFKEVKSIQEAMQMMKGGGGTAFCPVFDAIEDMRHKPNILVFCTDGGNFDELPEECPIPGLQVIWLLVGAHRCMPSCKGELWGEVIEIDDDDDESDRRRVA